MMAEISTQVDNLKTSRKELRKFGISLFFLLTIITCLMLWKGNSYWVLSAVVGLFFLFSGLAIPTFLNSFYRIWMTLGFALSWIITRLILAIAFFLIFTPIGLLLRIFGKDLLDIKIEKAKKTYWKKCRAAADRLCYLKRF